MKRHVCLEAGSGTGARSFRNKRVRLSDYPILETLPRWLLTSGQQTFVSQPRSRPTVHPEWPMEHGASLHPQTSVFFMFGCLLFIRRLPTNGFLSMFLLPVGRTGRSPKGWSVEIKRHTQTTQFDNPWETTSKGWRSPKPSLHPFVHRRTVRCQGSTGPHLVQGPQSSSAGKQCIECIRPLGWKTPSREIVGTCPI